jgi:hypothetical protein
VVKQEFPPLPDDLKIYRAIVRKTGWFDPYTKKIDAKAFKLRLNREPDPETNISMAFTPVEACNAYKGKTFGVIEIKVRDIRALGLDAVQTSKSHIAIMNIPINEKDAIDFAIRLAEKARLLD